MADILTLADARLALRLPAADTSNDADLTATYIPAVTPIVEDVIGPVMTMAGRILTVDGGQETILLPSAVTSVQQVTESGVVLTAGTDYTVSLASGWIARGSSSQSGATFKDGTQNVVVSYTAGAAAAPANVAGHIKLAARIILAQLFQADEGYRPQFGSPDDDMEMTPSGFAIPRRAMELLRGAVTIPGFA
jgi:hypothetical protein